MKQFWAFCLLLAAFFFTTVIVNVPVYAELNLTCNSIDDNNFDEIHVMVTPDEDGNSLPNLSTANFSITEDGVSQDVLECTGSGSADIIFAIDSSRSMNDEIDEVIDNIDDFLDDLENEGIDWKVGFVEFGNNRIDLLGHPNPVVLNDGKLTDDRDLIKLFLAHIRSSDGGIEPGLDAVQMGCESFDFRAGSYRRVLLMTDENSDPSCEIQPVIECLDDIGMVADCFINENAWFDRGDSGCPYFAWQQYGKQDTDNPPQSEPDIGICGATGGLVFSTEDPIDEVFDEIRKNFRGQYDCRYNTTNKVDCGKREVNVTVTVDGEAASCSLFYDRIETCYDGPCNQTLEDSELTLTEDMDCTGADFCFKLKRATLVMDCYECFGAKTGMILEDDSELRGGTVRNCGVGIKVEGNNNSVIVMRSNDNASDGLQVAGNYNKISESVFADNGAAGIQVDGDKNEIYGNQALGNADGIKVENNARANYLINNDVIENKGPGIRLQDTKNNVVRKNYVESNLAAGIWAEITAVGNVIKSNYSKDNKPDMKEAHSACSQNTWKFNNFGTKDPGCIR